MDPPGAAAVVPVNGLSFIHRTVTMTSYFNQVPPPPPPPLTPPPPPPPPLPPLLREVCRHVPGDVRSNDAAAQFETRKTKK